jgi:hypothetical protein
VAVAILVVGFVVTMSPNVNSGSSSSSPSSGGTTQNSSVQAGNQTYIATYVSSLSTPTAYTTSSTSSTSSTSVTPSSTSTTSVTSTQSVVTGGSFTYTSSSQVKILYVAATVSSGVIGFSVQFENVGSGAIYVLSGGGSSLNATITSGASNIRQVSSPRCEIVEALLPVNPGETWSAHAPGCWSGYYYQVLGPGTIQVQMTLTWSGGTSQGGGSDSLTINAEFTLS